LILGFYGNLRYVFDVIIILLSRYPAHSNTPLALEVR